MKKQVLFVSYHFPPDSEVGGRRIARLASFLRGRGWDVGVLTVRERHYEQRDSSFSQQGFAVYRTAMIESIRFLFGGMRGNTARLFKRKGAPGGAESAGASGPNEGTLRKPLATIKRFILSLIWCPDDRQGWIPFAAAKCISLSRRYPLIYSSSPPYSTAIASLLARAFLPSSRWIAEFRDPWTACYKPEFVVSSFSRRIERRLESAVVNRCSRVVVVNEAMKRDFAERYPSCADKIWVASNGFDSDRLEKPASREAARDPRRAVFLHAGSLYQGRDPSTFLVAVSELVREGSLDPGFARVVFIGDSNAGGRSIRDVAAEHGIENVVRVMGYVPYEQCLAEMNNADVLLLFNINQPLQVPAKFYEYIGLRKKVLCVSTGGITDELIAETKIGLSVHPNDLEGIKNAIRALIELPLPAGDPDAIDRFKTSSIFSRLAIQLEAFMESLRP